MHLKQIEIYECGRGKSRFTLGGCLRLRTSTAEGDLHLCGMITQSRREKKETVNLVFVDYIEKNFACRRRGRPAGFPVPGTSRKHLSSSLGQAYCHGYGCDTCWWGKGRTVSDVEPSVPVMRIPWTTTEGRPTTCGETGRTVARASHPHPPNPKLEPRNFPPATPWAFSYASR